jgi:hypothetical protein
VAQQGAHAAHHARHVFGIGAVIAMVSGGQGQQR